MQNCILLLQNFENLEISSTIRFQILFEHYQIHLWLTFPTLKFKKKCFWKKKPHLLLVRENIKALLINWFEIEKTDSTKQETMKKALGRKQDTLFCMKKKNIRQTNRKKETKKFCCCWLEKERKRGKEREKKERGGKGEWTSRN